MTNAFSGSPPPPPPPPWPPWQGPAAMPQPFPDDRDRQHLGLLRVFYYVLAGFTALGVFFLIGYAMFLAWFFPVVMQQVSNNQPPGLSPPIVFPVSPSTAPASGPFAEAQEPASMPSAGPTIGVVPTSGPASATPLGQAQGMQTVSSLVTVFLGINAALSAFMAVLMFLAGRYLVRCKHYVFCFAIAVLACLSFPLGTALGIFTIMVLIRPSVKALFGRAVVLE